TPGLRAGAPAAGQGAKPPAAGKSSIARCNQMPARARLLARLVAQPGDDGVDVVVAQHFLDEARHLAVRPVAYALGAAQEFLQRRQLEIVDRVHRLAEVGTLLAVAGALEAMAGDAQRDVAVEPTARWMAGGK